MISLVNKKKKNKEKGGRKEFELNWNIYCALFIYFYKKKLFII